LSLWK